MGGAGKKKHLRNASLPEDGGPARRILREFVISGGAIVWSKYEKVGGGIGIIQP